MTKILRASSWPRPATSDRLHRAKWDYYARPSGLKAGIVSELRPDSCLLRTTDPVGDRWLRLVIQPESADRAGIHALALVGRIVSSESAMETVDSRTVTLHRYAVRFSRSPEPEDLTSLT